MSTPTLTHAAQAVIAARERHGWSPEADDALRVLRAALEAFVARDESAPMVLPDGSAFGVISFPLPDNHWLYAPREYMPGEDEPIELPTPCLQRTPENYERAKLAIRYAIRGATMCGKETDFDPDALVQNALYALLGPSPQRATAAAPEAPEQAAQAADVARLVDLLREAAATFRRYEALHRAKSTADGDAKAEANAAIAGRIEAALTAKGGDHA